MDSGGEMRNDNGVSIGEDCGGQKSASLNVPPRFSSPAHKTRWRLRPPPLLILDNGVDSESSSATSRHRRATVADDFSHRDTKLRSPPQLSPIASIPLITPPQRLPPRNITAVTPAPRIDPPPRHWAKSPSQSSQSEGWSGMGISTANEEMRACGREKHQHRILRSILRYD